MKYRFEKEFREAHPETLCEPDKYFDLSNYNDWLEDEYSNLLLSKADKNHPNMPNNRLEWESKTIEILRKFNNGEINYKESALFNTVIETLVRGCDEYKIIDMLIEINIDLNSRFEEYIKTSHRPLIIPKQP
jgi:hypothetical protein